MCMQAHISVRWHSWGVEYIFLFSLFSSLLSDVLGLSLAKKNPTTEKRTWAARSRYSVGDAAKWILVGGRIQWNFTTGNGRGTSSNQRLFPNLFAKKTKKIKKNCEMTYRPDRYYDEDLAVYIYVLFSSLLVLLFLLMLFSLATFCYPRPFSYSDITILYPVRMYPHSTEIFRKYP